MHPAITQLEQASRKPAVPQVQSGDTVRVHQLIREGSKQRVQVFEGVVIRTDRMNSVSASITVRRIASGVGVEKTFLLHSPNVSKVDIMRRGRVRRNFLSYLRERRGKSARLREVSFDRAAANDVTVAQAEPTDDQPTVTGVDGNPVDADAAVTEINVDQNQDALDQVEESTERVAVAEDRQAAADEPKPTDGDTDQGDEAVIEQTEAESGVQRGADEK
jgi:large subunit ribosomal protein L19